MGQRVNTHHVPHPRLRQCSLQRPLTQAHAAGTGRCRAWGEAAVLVSRAFTRVDLKNRDDDDDGFDSH
ncbi:hypothetical protein B296_00041679 [Ensete ventricosum]|uniref:Uncharacterized protein n=1 Tax=Ensete ventricosum TaxID=4639 RepID=A0A426XUF8_ENSVE|nr:hypothetical protein B296_00041679 [Ensete ventricosum]